MTLPFALLGSVACLCASGLVAWRWWLAHTLAQTQAKVRDMDKEWGQLNAFSERLKALEYRTSGR